MAYIGTATADLKDIEVFDKKFSFKKDVRFIARDGVLRNQIIAGNIKVLAETKQFDNKDIEGAVVFENEKNKADITAIAASTNTKAVKDIASEAYALEKELAETRKSLKEKDKELTEIKKNMAK